MSDVQRKIYDFYETKVYNDAVLYGVYEKEEKIEVSFKYEDTIEISEMSDIKSDLSYFLDNQDEEHLAAKKILITFFSYSNDPGDWFVISNYADDDKYHEIAGYDDNQNGWWLYSVRFDDWRELEDNFSYVEGVCRCRVREFGDISDIDPLKWENLKYIQIYYYGDDADIYEQKLKRLFPDVEVHLGPDLY